MILGGGLRRILALGLGLAASAAQASSLQFCDQHDTLSAAQKDRLLRWAALIKDELAASDASVALVSRSGLDLARFGIRYSHAGIALRGSSHTPWSVRQLYYACDEKRPRIFDQGLAGFLLGMNDPEAAFVSVVLVPGPAGEQLAQAAGQAASALQLLSPDYSANAYAFSTRYQNCNQWLIELIAATWGGLAVAESDAAPDALLLRQRAQSWLQTQGYAPTPVAVRPRVLTWASAFIPWVHSDDHPDADRANAIFRVSLPTAIEQFVQGQVPGSQRLEMCFQAGRVVIHKGWQPLGAVCEAGDGDRVVRLD